MILKQRPDLFNWEGVHIINKDHRMGIAHGHAGHLVNIVVYFYRNTYHCVP